MNVECYKLTRSGLTAVVYVLLLVWGLGGASVQAGFDHLFLEINGDTTATTVTQGDIIAWGATCDSGATINVEVWFDVNDNATIDRTTDLILTSENITDGDGITEADPVLDGVVKSEDIYLAGEVGNYLFRATDIAADSSLEIVRSMVAMASPPNQISGRVLLPGVTPPSNQLANILVFADAEGAGILAVTDSMGDYSMNISDEGTGYTVEILPRQISGFVPPTPIEVLISGVSTGNDMAFAAATDSVWGHVRDDLGALLSFETSVIGESDEGFRDANTVDSRYVLYFSATDGGDWEIEFDSRVSPLYLNPQSWSYAAGEDGSMEVDFTLLRADGIIYAQISENGGPIGQNVRVDAYSSLLGVSSEAIALVGSDNMARVPISTLDPDYWTVGINVWDDDVPLPSGLIKVSDAYDVSPGDTVDLALKDGVPVSGSITLDPGDGPLVSDVYVSGGQYGTGIESTGPYTFYSDTGTYYVGVFSEEYLGNPAVREVIIDGSVSGVDFMVNHRHCRVTGTLTGVSLPLDNDYYQVTARTGTSEFDGYSTWTFVDRSTGTFEMYLPDGDWTVLPPGGFPQTPPAPENLTISEYPDTLQTVVFDYTDACCVGMRGNVNDSPDDFVNIVDMTWLAGYLFTGGLEPPCFEEADVNGDGQINIVDMTWLAAYLFTGGAAPTQCP